MKSILKGLLVGLALVAIVTIFTVGFNYLIDNDEITVLEISIIEGYGDTFDYRISYVEKSMFGKRASHIDFQTFLGIKNYLEQVADHDLSQWRTTKQ